MTVEFRAHSPEQYQALTFTTPVGLLACGIQFGKTKVGSVWMKTQNHTFTSSDDNFLVVSPTYKILTQSTLPPYLQIMADAGDFSKSDMALRIHGGGTVYMRSSTDPDSVVGITNIRAIWGDEAGLFTLYFSENLAARAAFKTAQTLYTTSPYTLNWLYRQIIQPKMRDKTARPDVTLIQAASWQNPFFPKDVIERNRLTMDPKRFNAMFGGQWERMSGLVYDCFDEVENQCDPFPLPPGTKIVGGIDWGFSDPFVFQLRAITPNGHQFQIQEFYKSGLTIMDIENVLIRLCQVHDVGAIYCGPDQPGHMEHLNRAFHKAHLKAHCMGADNSIRTGIDRHYELLKTRKLKLWRGCNPYSLDEISVFHYPNPEDLKPDQNSKDALPVKQQDHAMDCSRYISTSIYLGQDKRPPFVPNEISKNEDQYKRIERLKRRPRFAKTENWG